MDPSRKHPKAFLAFVVLLAGGFTLGCAARLRPPKAEQLREGIPAGYGLVFGRVQGVIKRSLYLFEDGKGGQVTQQRLDVHLLNVTTNDRLTFKTGRYGDFFLLLPAGGYEITGVWGTGYRIWKKGAEKGWGFDVPAGSSIYLGTLALKGFPPKEIAVVDEFESARQRLQARYPTLAANKGPVKGLINVAGNYGETLRVHREFIEGPRGRSGVVVVPGR